MTAGCVIDGSRRRRCCDRNEKENRQEKENGVEVMLFGGGRGGEGVLVVTSSGIVQGENGSLAASQICNCPGRCCQTRPQQVAWNMRSKTQLDG